MTDAEAEIRLEHIIEALLLAAPGPMSVDALHKLLGEELGLDKAALRQALAGLARRLDESSACQLREVAGGWRIQVRQDYAEWVAKLWQEKPPRYSRAALETLALIVYRQPITRGEIEEVRGVAVSSNILRGLIERGWVQEVGQRETPGRPSLFGTTRQFLDDFDIKSLDELPALPDIQDLDRLEDALRRLGIDIPESGSADASEEDQVVKSVEMVDPEKLPQSQDDDLPPTATLH